MSLSREQMLQEMGIGPIWVLRQPSPADTAGYGPETADD